MGSIEKPSPVLMFCAVYGQQPESLQWARLQMVKTWGPIALASTEMQFQDTSYYEATMGANLRKQLLAFHHLRAPEDLPPTKIQSNQWEKQYLESGTFDVQRPVNIDPGYVTLAKLVLATTKDRDHRLYLGQGIFAEVTLHYKHGQWRSDRWTYPDFQRPEYHQFLEQCRELLKGKLRVTNDPIKASQQITGLIVDPLTGV